MIYAVQMGLRLTSDCFSEEKREGTLGLLFLTDLKGFDVVFGKLAANSIGSLYGMLAVFPVIAISILLGGVTGAEFARVNLVALNLLFFSLCVGIFASSLCRDERRSLSLAALIAMILSAFGPLLFVLLSIKTRTRAWEPFCVPSPACGAFLAFNTNYFGHASEFWTCTAITHLYSWVFLLFACRIVPRSWQDATKTTLAAKLGRFAAGMLAGRWRSNEAVAAEKHFRTHLLEINPFTFLALRTPLKARAVWILLLFFVLVWIAGIYYAGKDWFEPGVYVMTAIFAHVILKVWLAGEASRRFVEDRRNGAMEWLLCTPLSVDDILRGQRIALLRQFGWPCVAVVSADFILFTVGYNSQDIHQDKTWLLVWFSGIVIFVMDMFALSWIGMWTGLVAQKSNRAAGAAVTRILFLPWLVFGLVMSAVGMLSMIPITRPLMDKINVSEDGVIVLWLLLGVGNNFFWMFWAKRGLHTRFRELAVQRVNTASRFNWFRSAPKPPVVAS